jgi:hypothetical protein
MNLKSIKASILLILFAVTIVSPVATLVYCQVCKMDEHACCAQPVKPVGAVIEMGNCCEKQVPQVNTANFDLIIPAVKQLMGNLISVGGGLAIQGNGSQVQPKISQIFRDLQVQKAADFPLFILNHSLLI